MLERWSRTNAVAMLGACGVSLGVGHSWPVAASAVFSFALLLGQSGGAWTPQGEFGSSNRVTALRLLVTLLIGFGWGKVPSLAFAAVVLGLLVLDGVDGWLARRNGSASAFGAHFDMESDALMVLVVELALWQRGGLGAWILITGLLRYVYVLALALVPARRGALPRSRFGRYAFAALAVGLCAALVSSEASAMWPAAIGTALVTASFARAFLWSYRAPSPREVSGANLLGPAPGR
jgi:phosphatidylglycerophosphate synthase